MQIHHFAFLLFFISFTACQQVQEKAFPMAEGLAIQTSTSGQGTEKAVSPAANIIFKSADGGQTWQDISAGLPAVSQADGFFASDGELYVGTEQGMYRSSTASAAPVWEQEMSLDKRSSTLSAGRAGVFAYNYDGHFLQKINGTSIWLPVFKNYPGPSVRLVFETKDGHVFIGCDRGMYKSEDKGQTWKHVYEKGWVIDMVESNGVLLCTNEQGILRSMDGGEHWEGVLYEGGVGIDVEPIDGGFAAINYNTESETRRVRMTTDNGKTWQPIDAGLPAQKSIASIKQVGDYFFCGHPKGIYRSADRGKTWELILPAIGEKVFNLSVSGNVIYAVPRNGGC